MAEMNPGQTWECEQKLPLPIGVSCGFGVLLHRQDDDDKRLY